MMMMMTVLVVVTARSTYVTLFAKTRASTHYTKPDPALIHPATVWDESLSLALLLQGLLLAVGLLHLLVVIGLKVHVAQALHFLGLNCAGGR